MPSQFLYQKYNFLPADGGPLPPLLFLLHRKSKSNSKTKRRLTEKSKTKANSEHLPTLAAKTMESARVASNTQHYVLSPHLLYVEGVICHYHPLVASLFLFCHCTKSFLEITLFWVSSTRFHLGSIKLSIV